MKAPWIWPQPKLFVIKTYVISEPAGLLAPRSGSGL